MVEPRRQTIFVRFSREQISFSGSGKKTLTSHKSRDDRIQWLGFFFCKPSLDLLLSCSSSTMLFSSALPATLMDLTILRLSSVLSPKTPVKTLAPFVFGKSSSTFRRIHGQATALTSTNVSKLEPFPSELIPNNSNGRYASFTFFSVTQIFLTFGMRFRLHEKMKGGLTALSSGTDGRALYLVKELERRVEALDDTTQAEVCRVYSFGIKLIYDLQP